MYSPRASWYFTRSGNVGLRRRNSSGRSSSSHGPAVEDRNAAVLGDQDDALAHVIQGQAELLRLLQSAPLAAQQLCFRQPQAQLIARTLDADAEDDQSEYETDDCVAQGIAIGRREYLILRHAHSYCQRQVADPAEGDDAVAVWRGVDEGSGLALVHPVQQARTSDILTDAQTAAPARAAGRSDAAVQADQRNRAALTNFDRVGRNGRNAAGSTTPRRRLRRSHRDSSIAVSAGPARRWSCALSRDRPRTASSCVPCMWTRTCSRSLRSIGGGCVCADVDARRMPRASVIENRLIDFADELRNSSGWFAGRYCRAAGRSGCAN